MELYLLHYNIKIHTSDSEYEDLGSTMKCWVVANNQIEAKKKVIDETKEYGWQILELISSKIVLAEEYDADNPERHHVDNAIKSGITCYIRTKPRKK